MGMHFFIFQGIGTLLIFFLMSVLGKGQEVYYENAVLVTGLSGLCTVFPAVFLYKKDKIRRMAGGLLPGIGQNRLTCKDGILLLILGAGAAHFFNFVVGILQLILESTQYQENMARMTNGKSLLMLIFWMGIVAPVSEEITFRWLVYLRLRDYVKVRWAAVISGVLFGVYHGNILQAVYAAILGIIFAYVLEATGNLLSSILLHMGANIWSLIISQFAGNLVSSTWINIFGMAILCLFAVSGVILAYYLSKGKKRNQRCI